MSTGWPNRSLIDLNRKIIERLRLLQQMRAHRQMLAFKIGDWVTVRRIYVAMAYAGPFQDEFALAHVLLRRAGARAGTTQTPEAT